jgi:toxin ParE1/3/4
MVYPFLGGVRFNIQHFWGKSYEFLRSGIRGIPLEGYIIFYRFVETDIIILRVVSGRQNLANLFTDDEEN